MFHDLVVRSVRPEGRDAVAVSFEAPEGAEFTWQPGQYLTLRAPELGNDLRRSYSIASLPGEPLTVGIKKVEGGAFSSFAQALKAGDRLEAMAPDGRFIDPGCARLVLIAAGSGITPMVSIAGAALARGAEVALIFGNRRSDTIMFHDRLEALKDRYLGRFSVTHILSQEMQDVPLLNGRIDGAKITRLAQAGAVDVLGADGVFLCGPGGLIDDGRAALVALGVPADRIHDERFTAASGGGFALPPSKAAQAVAAAGVDVTVQMDGVTRRFDMVAQDGSILEAAERQGLDVPYSCRGGMCCTCRCRVTEGAVEMAVNYSLEPWEIEAGFVLACQARPTTDRVSVDFDAA